jgi:hypothetical protein
MRKKARDIKLVKVEECKTAKIVVEVDDELFEAMAQAGRKHIAKDKVACFSYALNKALLELCEEVK